jgi:Peptidase S46
MIRRIALAVLLVLAMASLASADEGMWLYNHPPTAKIKAKYGFQLTQKWLDHTRLSSVRFNNGGSGSFVSPDGLTFTNHHVAQTCLYGLSKEGQDLYKTGFYAKTQAEEAKCPNLELNQLVGIEDVTAKVNEGVTSQMPAAQAGDLQRKNMAKIEADCHNETGLRCDTVVLYAGGQYNLYKYKKYTDVRLVFAPEFHAAFFGGDPDNFEYPRYDLDITFFRVYENGKPAKLDNYLKFTTAGVKDNELVFVSGHPGSTGRLNTYAQMEYLRDRAYPFTLKSLARRIDLLQKWAAESPENARRAQEMIFGLQNSYKAINGYQSGLLNKAFMARKEASEKKLRASVETNPKKKAEFGDPWAEVEGAMDTQRQIFLPLNYFERLGGFRGDLPGLARTLVRIVIEKQKPNDERLPEYRQSRLPSVEQTLFSTAPIYKDLDALILSGSLSEMSEQMPSDPVLKQVLNGRTPDEAAKEMISNTKLQDVAYRKELYDGGEQAVANSSDPLIQVMRLIDPESRKVRKQYEDQVDSVERASGAKIAKIMFAQEGYNMPPDATFTLRLSYGTAKGYTEDGRGDVAKKGEHVPYFTTMGGAYNWATKHDFKPPYDLPQSWIDHKQKVNLNTPLNFASTPDIIGGNSGSPVVNKAGNVVGIIFDGNIQSLPWRFQYEDVIGRAVSVDTRGIVEALRNVYGATRVADELMAPSGKIVTVVHDGKKATKKSVKVQP